MPEPSVVDHAHTPPKITVPRDYNAAHDLIERNLRAGRAEKIAFIDDAGSYTYADVERRSSAFANVLASLGVEQEQRALLCLHDTVDFPTAFLGAIKAGVMPVAVNTLLTQGDYEYMVRDSRARVVVASAPLAPMFRPLLGKVPTLRRILVSGDDASEDSLASHMAAAPTTCAIAATTCDDPCFWLYSSGSTGAPEGTVHVHSSLIQTAELYARPIIGIRDSDVVFSAAKLFFAYGLGNGLTFPMAVGATAVLMAERPTPEAVFARLRKHRPTVFYGVPTLFAAMLAHPGLPVAGRGGDALLHVGGRGAAGRDRQALVAPFRHGHSRRHRLHRDAAHLPFQPQRRRPVRHDRKARSRLRGAPGRRGRKSRAARRDGRAADPRTDQRLALLEQSREDLQYVHGTLDAQRRQVFAGRAGLLRLRRAQRRHAEGERHLRLADRGRVVADHPRGGSRGCGHRQGGRRQAGEADRLRRPEVRLPALAGDGGGASQHVKSLLAPYKYPRWFEFVDDLPKTATGKIQRFKLRERVRADRGGASPMT